MKKYTTFQVTALLIFGGLAYLAYAQPGQREMPAGVHEIPQSDAAELTLSLEQAISLALKANRSVIASANGMESQELSLVAATSEFDLKVVPRGNVGASDYYKEMSGGVSLNKKFEFGPRASVTPGVGWADEGGTIGEIGLGLEIPLLRGFGKDTNLDSVRSSEYSLRSAQRSFYMTKVNVVLDTVSAVYNIIKEEELVALYEDQAARFAGHADAARIKEKSGLATPMDIYRAEIKLKGAQEGLARARESLWDAKDRLKLVLAFPMETELNVSAPIRYKPIHINLAEAANIALSKRIELEQAEDSMDEAKRRSVVAKDNTLPELNLSMGYKKSNFFDDLSRVQYSDEDRWSVNIVSRSDWSRTAEKAAYQQSLVNVRTSRLNIDAKKDEIVRQVRRQVDALRKTDERIALRNEQIKQAEGQLALAQIKFNHQMANNFDIIEAETELQNSKGTLLSDKSEYIVGTYRMRAVLGTLLER